MENYNIFPFYVAKGTHIANNMNLSEDTLVIRSTLCEKRVFKSEFPIYDGNTRVDTPVIYWHPAGLQKDLLKTAEVLMKTGIGCKPKQPPQVERKSIPAYSIFKNPNNKK